MIRQGYALIDCMDLGINETYCSCGQRLFPDCDISSVSIAQEFERHLQEAHGRQVATTGDGYLKAPHLPVVQVEEETSQ